MQNIEIPVRGSKLLHANIYHIDKNAPFVILCHGFTGDQHEWGRFDKTAFELNKNGYNALTFDFSGSGKNKREIISLTKQSEDLIDIFAWVKEQGYKKISTLGLSFGGMTSLVSELPERDTAIFWAPAFYFDQQFTLKQKLKLKFASFIGKTPVEIESVSEPILIDYSFMSDPNNKNTDHRIKSIEIPVLIIHGSEDKTIPHARSEIAFEKLKTKKRRILIEGAGHDFNGEFLDEFIKLTIKFLDDNYQSY